MPTQTNYQRTQDVIRENRPAGATISMDRVKEIYAEMGYKFATKISAQNKVQLTRESPNGKIVTRWSFKDIEEAGYMVVERGGTYQLEYISEEKPENYIPILDAWTKLVDGGYKLYCPYVETEGRVIVSIDASDSSYGTAYNCFRASNTEIQIWWNGKIEGDEVVYTPFIRGGMVHDWTSKISRDFADPLFEEAGIAQEEVRVKIQTRFVKPLIPEYVIAGEYWTDSDQVPFAEAQEKSVKFALEMQAEGLLGDHVLVSKKDIKELIDAIPGGYAPIEFIELINRIEKLIAPNS